MVNLNKLNLHFFFEKHLKIFLKFPIFIYLSKKVYFKSLNYFLKTFIIVKKIVRHY
jgi:hypothetical protein